MLKEIRLDRDLTLGKALDLVLQAARSMGLDEKKLRFDPSFIRHFEKNRKFFPPVYVEVFIQAYKCTPIEAMRLRQAAGCEIFPILANSNTSYMGGSLLTDFGQALQDMVAENPDLVDLELSCQHDALEIWERIFYLAVEQVFKKHRNDP